MTSIVPEFPIDADLGATIAEIHFMRNERRLLEFADVERYCIAKWDETLCVFLEMQHFIQSNLDVFVDSDDVLSPRSRGNPEFGRTNGRNRVCHFGGNDFLSARNVCKHLVWVDGGIAFLLNGKTVVGISRMNLKEEEWVWNTCRELHTFNFFSDWSIEDTPNKGYTRFDSAPTMEDRFRNEHPSTFEDWKSLKERVDEDYKDALECKNLLVQAVKGIQEDERKYLDGIRELKANSKEEKEA